MLYHVQLSLKSSFTLSRVDGDHSITSTTPTLSGRGNPINFCHFVDFFLHEYSQFRRFDNPDFGAVAEDGFDQLAEIGGGEFQAEGAVCGGVGGLFRVPALFLDPWRDLRRKLQYDPTGGVALHDAEMFAGIFLEVRQVGGDGEFFVGRGEFADASQGEVAQVAAACAPGDEVPAAHIVHEMQGLDGSGRGGFAVRGVVGDPQTVLLEQRFHGLPEDGGVDHGVFDILDRDHPVDLLQAVLLVSSGRPGYPVDQPAEIVLQRRIGDSRGQADGERQGQDVSFADPVAGNFEGGVGVAEPIAPTIEFERGVEAIAHELDTPVGGAFGDFEFLDKMTAVGEFAGLDPVVEPEKTLDMLLLRHFRPPFFTGSL